MDRWERARPKFPITARMIFMDVALGNAMPDPVLERMKELYRSVQTNGPRSDHFEAFVESARESLAGLMGADAREIAFTKNTSDGINIIANGLGLAPGDNVVLNDLEHPSNREPWLNLRSRGVGVKVARSRDRRLNPGDVFALVDARTRVVAISHVEYASGVRNDVARYAELARDQDVLLVVDGIQSAGVLRCDLHELGVDVFAAGGHKALFGPHGSGFLFCSKRILGKISPAYAGMSPAVDAAWDAEEGARFSVDQEDARKFEYGNLNVAGIVALGAGAELILELGIGAIEKRVLELTGRLHDGLVLSGVDVVSPREDGERAGIVIVAGPQPARFHAFLEESGVRASLMSSGVVRFSPHFYNTTEEVDRVVELAGEYLSTRKAR